MNVINTKTSRISKVSGLCSRCSFESKGANNTDAFRETVSDETKSMLTDDPSPLDDALLREMLYFDRF